MANISIHQHDDGKVYSVPEIRIKELYGPGRTATLHAEFSTDTVTIFFDNRERLLDFARNIFEACELELPEDTRENQSS